MIVPDSASAERRSRVATRLGWLTGVLLLAAVVLVATHMTEERQLAQLLREADPLWLLGAGLLQVLTYVCAAGVWQRALTYLGVEAPLMPLVPLGLAKLFTDRAERRARTSATW
jgi:hypothetical protein